MRNQSRGLSHGLRSWPVIPALVSGGMLPVLAVALTLSDSTAIATNTDRLLASSAFNATLFGLIVHSGSHLLKRSAFLTSYSISHATVTFLSDHGEALGEISDFFTHIDGRAPRQVYEIPLIFWTSPAFRTSAAPRAAARQPREALPDGCHDPHPARPLRHPARLARTGACSPPITAHRRASAKRCRGGRHRRPPR